MTRTTTRVGAIMLALLLAGCLIKGPEPQPEYFSVIRIIPNSNDRPPYGLLPAPPGHIYQFWAYDTASNARPVAVFPLQRFQWNTEYFFALDEHGDTLPLTIDPGLDLGINLLDHQGLIVSIEPLSDPNPSQVDGPVIMFADIDQFTRMNLEADFRVPTGLVNLASNEFSLVAQSLVHDVPGACWRSNSEGMGVWFAKPIAKDKEILDTVGPCLHPSCVTKGTLLGRHNKGIDYFIWYFPDHLDSSFSNYGTVFADREPDIVFRNGVPQHVGRTGPRIPLGADRERIIRGGQTVGYIDYNRDTLGQIIDTCYLRIDYPESTHCASDTVCRYCPFSDTILFKRSFTTIWGDTTVASSLPGIAPVDPLLGLEYEAWVVFDSSTGLTKPLSLGRFTDKDGRDRSNPYTDMSNYDPHFNVPGEDFIHNLPSGLPSPLDLLAMVQSRRRVKVWITLEPIDDWAPAEPFKQLIMFSGEVVEDRDTTINTDCAARSGESSPPAYSLPLTFREISASKDSRNEGYNWPSMHVFLRRPAKK